MSKEDLVKLVERILSASGNEEEIEQMLVLFSSQVPHPSATDLIFYPSDQSERSASEIVELALAYKAVTLGQSA